MIPFFAGAVIWLSVPRWHTRDKFLWLSGAAFAAGLWLMLTLSMSMGFAWLCLAGAITRTLKWGGMATEQERGPMAQKLALASAHIDMGNRVEADALLREVIRDGTPAQKIRAARLTKPSLS